MIFHRSTDEWLPCVLPTNPRSATAAGPCGLPIAHEGSTFCHMTAVLDVPEIRNRVLRVSVADYRRHTEGQQSELLRGIVIEKMSRSPLHSYIADALRETLAAQIGPDFIALLESR